MSAPLLIVRRRGVLRAAGRDPVKMLQGLATADIEAVSPERGVYTAFLTPKGRMVADARVFRHPAPEGDGVELLIDVDPGALAPLQDHFRKFVPPLFARFTDESDRWALVGVYGTAAGPVAEAAMETVGATASGGLPREAPEESAVALGGALAGIAVRTRVTGEGGWEMLVPASAAEELESALQAAGAAPAPPEALERWRIEAGRPAWGTELTDEVIPLEAGLLDRAISQAKGCYTGQEVIVRILHRGHVNRHLRRLRADEETPSLVPGAELFEAGGERPRGTVTSATKAGDGVVALGYVRREIEPPAVLHVGSPEGPEVRVEALDGAT